MNSNKIEQILSLSKFFKPKIIKNVTYITLEKPSLILLHNIRAQYLQFTHIKAGKNIPIYLNRKHIKDLKVPYGFIEHSPLPKEVLLSHKSDIYDITNPSELILHLVYPKQDIMQHFIKWQRYRKYWWSSITTTPSLFLINDMKQENNTINVNTVANFPWSQQVVENITLNIPDNESSNNSHLVCKMGLENALFTIMLDALSNGTKEGYFRLHNKLAPFKISFALSLKDQDPTENKSLIDLANLIHYQLKVKKISSWLPEFSLQIQDQIKENLELGITYTVILSDVTLKNGTLHLLNSSTMLKEQIHISDFENYAQMLCLK